MSIPSLPLSGGLGCYHPSISQGEISRLSDAETRAHQISSLWDRVKDWFCGTKRVEAKKCIYEMFHNPSDANRMKAFIKLRKLAPDTFKDKFNMYLGQHGQMQLSVGDKPDNKMMTLNLANDPKGFESYNNHCRAMEEPRAISKTDNLFALKILLENNFNFPVHHKINGSDLVESDLFNFDIERRVYRLDCTKPDNSGRKGKSSTSDCRLDATVYVNGMGHLFVSTIKSVEDH